MSQTSFFGNLETTSPTPSNLPTIEFATRWTLNSDLQDRDQRIMTSSACDNADVNDERMVEDEIMEVPRTGDDQINVGV